MSASATATSLLVLVLTCAVLTGALLTGTAFALSSAGSREKTSIPAIRWNEANPGCTFSHSDDGKLHYGLWSGDVGITVTVDSQELEKVHRRHEPFFAALIEVRYRGQGVLPFTAENISLEFVKHFRVAQTALDPDDFAQKVESDADEVDHEAAREVQKHPERKGTKEAYVRTFQKETAELIEFVSKNSLRPARLTPGNPDTGGWVFFSSSNEWISGWKKREEFILRVPADGKVFEFPFALPPQAGEVMLRKRQ